MAISHARPLLLLLASLFFLPALSAVNFKYCNKSGYAYGKVTRVETSPNPAGPDDFPNIMVSGSANNSSKTINEGTVEVGVTYPYEKSFATYDLCDDLHACPIEAGKNFELHLSDIPYTSGIQDGVKVSVTLIDDFGEPEYIDKEPETRLCVEFAIPTTDPTLVYPA